MIQTTVLPSPAIFRISGMRAEWAILPAYSRAYNNPYRNGRPISSAIACDRRGSHPKPATQFAAFFASSFQFAPRLETYPLA
jgi:hypothetical protein